MFATRSPAEGMATSDKTQSPIEQMSYTEAQLLLSVSIIVIRSRMFHYNTAVEALMHPCNVLY